MFWPVKVVYMCWLSSVVILIWTHPMLCQVFLISCIIFGILCCTIQIKVFLRIQKVFFRNLCWGCIGHHWLCQGYATHHNNSIRVCVSAHADLTCVCPGRLPSSLPPSLRLPHFTQLHKMILLKSTSDWLHSTVSVRLWSPDKGGSDWEHTAASHSSSRSDKVHISGTLSVISPFLLCIWFISALHKAKRLKSYPRRVP